MRSYPYVQTDPQSSENLPKTETVCTDSWGLVVPLWWLGGRLACSRLDSASLRHPPLSGNCHSVRLRPQWILRWNCRRLKSQLCLAFVSRHMLQMPQLSQLAKRHCGIWITYTFPAVQAGRQGPTQATFQAHRTLFDTDYSGVICRGGHYQCFINPWVTVHWSVAIYHDFTGLGHEEMTEVSTTSSNSSRLSPTSLASDHPEREHLC